MGLSDFNRVDSLQVEGIVKVNYMAEWEDEDWDNWCSNFKKPDRVPDLNAGAASGTLVYQVPFLVPVKSLKRITIAYQLVRYYKATGCTLTSVNLMWNVMEISEMQRKSPKQKAKETTLNNPNLLKTTTVAKWSDAIKVHLPHVFGPS